MGTALKRQTNKQTKTQKEKKKKKLNLIKPVVKICPLEVSVVMEMF